MAERARLWTFMREALEAGQPLTLLLVAANKGSAPARAGTKMAVSADGSFGTIGGGRIEQRMVDQAKAIQTRGERFPGLHHFRHHPAEDGEASGMLCGGEQTILLYACSPTDLEVLRQLEYACKNRVAVTHALDAGGWRIETNACTAGNVEFMDGERWRYRETLKPPKQAYIVGAGHVGQALARLLTWLDFDITLLDERDMECSTPAGDKAWRQQTVDYASIDRHIPQGDDVFVFVMTHRHQADQLVVEKLAGKPVAYLGMLGSRYKAARIKAMLAQRLKPAQLDRIQAPMGLPIHSHTPQEIAISIAAELIQRLNAERGAGNTGVFSASAPFD